MALNLVGDTTRCKPDCAYFIERWTEWYESRIKHNYSNPMAFLRCEIKSADDSYMNNPRIGSKTRNMVRKANSLYYFREFNFNEHLADIDRINKSKPIRQDRPMQGWYTEPAEPTSPSNLCSIHRDVWYGAFGYKSGDLEGYCHLVCVNELGIVVSILSHALASSAINGLIAYMHDHAGVEWINYLYVRSATATLTDFKRRVGFDSNLDL